MEHNRPADHWTFRAECRGLPPELAETIFFGSTHTDHGTQRAQGYPRVALSICKQCQVRSECLSDALKMEWGQFNHDDEDTPDALSYGVYGGMKPQQRRALIWDLKRQGLGPNDLEKSRGRSRTDKRYTYDLGFITPAAG